MKTLVSNIINQFNKLKAKKKIFLYVLDALFGLCFISYIVLSIINNAQAGYDNYFYWLLYITFFVIIFYLILDDYKKHIALILFLIAFYILLMGGKFFLFIKLEDKDLFTLFRYTKLNYTEYILFNNLLFISYTVPYIIYRLYGYLNKKDNKIEVNETNYHYNKYKDYKFIIKLLIPISLVASVIEGAYLFLKIEEIGYITSYVENISAPFIISKISALMPFLVILLFALKPSREEIKTTSILYFISLGFSLLSGRRTEIVVGSLFLFWYIIFIDKKNIFKKKFITRKHLVSILIAGLLSIPLITLYSFVRSGTSIKDFNLLYFFSYFFESLGKSDSVIANLIVQQHNFPKDGLHYLIYPFKDVFNASVFTRDLATTITGLSPYTEYGQGLNKLMLTDNFSHWITYLVVPDLYFKGHGLGSSYIAELYLGLKIYGVIAYGMILGVIFSNTSRLSFEKPVKLIFFLVVMRVIFFIPRAGALGFIENIYEIILVILGVLFLGFLFKLFKKRLKRNKKAKENDIIKVLHVVGTMNRGGQETFTINIDQRINKDKYSFTYMYNDDIKCDYDDRIKEIGSSIVFPKKKKGLKLYNYLKENNDYDIIHVPTNSALNAIVAIVSSKLNGIDNVIIHSHSSKCENKILHYLSRFLLYFFDFTKLACSDTAAKWMFNDLEDVRIINNGIDLKEYEFNSEVRNAVRYELNIKEDDFVIGHVGRFVEVKNHKFIVDVFNEISKVKENAKLVLVGDGPLKQQIINQVKEYKLTDKVIFTGVRDDVNKLLMGFDIFILPSLFEGLPYTLVEAQSSSLQCFVSDVVTKQAQLIDDLVTFIALDKSAKEWADIIISNMKSDRLSYFEEISEAGFDVKNSAKILEDIYFNLK